MEAIEKPIRDMTDLEFCVHYITECSAFIDPFLFREIQKRGLYNYINLPPGTIAEKIAMAYARFAESGKVFGDPEIDAIAGAIDRLAQLRAQFIATDVVDAVSGLDILEQMKVQYEYIRDYFKP